MNETSAATIDWTTLPDQELLPWKICDLGLRLEGSGLEEPIRELHRELDARGLSFHPQCYLGDEWFSPDGVPTISIPFYLAHPRLRDLEQTMMLEVEGGNEADCLKLLRHEAGHAMCHAYQLHLRPDWQAVFGSPSVEFNDFYRFHPYSRRYVRHLENWYAQSHPEEDFAETFAVWLTPDLDWRTLYRGWPALKKLQFVDTLMAELGPTRPPVTKIQKPLDVRRLRRRLRTHYDLRRKFYAEDDPAFFDADLQRLFTSQPGSERPVSAAQFLQRERRMILDAVSFWTRERKFTVNRLLRKIMTRCRELKLYLPADDIRTRWEIGAYFTALVSNYSFTGKFKGSV